MTDPKIIPGIQANDALLMLAFGSFGAPFGMSVQPMVGSLFLQAAVSSFHQIQADAALASRTRLAEQFKSYKPELTLTADFNTQRDQKDLEDGVIDNRPQYIGVNTHAEMDADLIKDFDFSESEVEISLASAEGHRKKGEFEKAQGDIESAKSFILMLNEAEAHFQKNKKEGEIVITGTSPTGTVRFYEPRHQALWNRSVALEAQVAYEWHALDDKKQKFLEQRLQLTEQLKTEKNPAKQSELRKEIGKIDQEVKWLNQGILELGTFDQNIRVPSLSHTTHRERTRAKFLDGYLNHDEKKVEEARGEMFVLWKVQELETLQGKVFPSFIGQYPAHFSYPGLLDYSNESVADGEAKLQRGFQKMFWAKGQGKIYLNKPDSFEPEPKVLNEGKNIGEKDEVKPLPILTEHRRHLKQDTELGKNEERGAQWMMMGDTALLHAGRVRATSFPGSEKPQNKFSRTDVEDTTSYDQILLNTESGLKDVGAVQALVTGLDQTEGERNVGHGWYALGSQKVGNIVLLLKGEKKMDADGKEETTPNLSDFILALEAIDKKQNSAFKAEVAVPYFKAYLDQASAMRKNQLDSLKAEYLKRVSGNQAYADLLSTDEGWQKALAKGSPASVLGIPGLPRENQLWNQLYLQHLMLQSFEKRKVQIIVYLDAVASGKAQNRINEDLQKIIQKCDTWNVWPPTDAQSKQYAAKDFKESKTTLLVYADVVLLNSKGLSSTRDEIINAKSFAELQVIAERLSKSFSPLDQFKAIAYELRDLESQELRSSLNMMLDDVEIVARRGKDGGAQGEDKKKIEEFRARIDAIDKEKNVEKKIALVSELLQGPDSMTMYVLGVQIEMESKMAKDLKKYPEKWANFKEFVTLGGNYHGDINATYDVYIRTMTLAEGNYKEGKSLLEKGLALQAQGKLEEAQTALQRAQEKLQTAQQFVNSLSGSPVRDYMISKAESDALWYSITTGALILIVSTIATMGVGAMFNAAVQGGRAVAVAEGTSIAVNGARGVSAAEGLVVSGARAGVVGEAGVGMTQASRVGALGRFWAVARIPTYRFLLTSTTFGVTQQALTNKAQNGYFFVNGEKGVGGNLLEWGGSLLHNAAFFLFFEGLDAFVINPGVQKVLASRATRMAQEAGELGGNGKVLDSIFKASPAVQKKFFELAYKTLGLGAKFGIGLGKATVEWGGLNAFAAVTGDFNWSLKGQLPLIGFIGMFKGLGPVMEMGMEKAMKPYFEKMGAKFEAQFKKDFGLKIEKLNRRNEALGRRFFEAVGPEGKKILTEYANLPQKAMESPKGRELAAKIDALAKEIAPLEKKFKELDEQKMLLENKLRDFDTKRKEETWVKMKEKAEKGYQETTAEIKKIEAERSELGSKIGERKKKMGELENDLDFLVLEFQKGPEAQELMTRYQELVNKKLSTAEGSDLWFEAAQLSRDWVKLMESSPELIDFYDKEFPGLRNSQKQAAAHYDWMAFKTFSQEEVFVKGNSFGMKNTHDKYNPASGVDLIGQLPTIMGENANHPIMMEVSDKGVIEVTQMTVEGNQILGMETIQIQPKEKPSPDQIKLMQKAIAAGKRGKMMEAQAVEKHEALAEAVGVPGTLNSNAVVLGEKWGLADAAELPVAQPPQAPAIPNSKVAPASPSAVLPIDPNYKGPSAEAWLDGKMVWDIPSDIFEEPKSKAAK